MPAFDWTRLNANETAVLKVLLKHRGRDQAISLADTAAAVGLSRRRVQEAVKALVEQHRVPIGTIYAKPSGWFICVTEDERKDCRARLRGQALSLLRRSKSFDPRANPKLAELFQGQLALELNDA